VLFITTEVDISKSSVRGKYLPAYTPVRKPLERCVFNGARYKSHLGMTFFLGWVIVASSDLTLPELRPKINTDMIKEGIQQETENLIV
jgi:hypothetical protein